MAFIKHIKTVIAVFALSLLSSIALGAPASFDQAKVEAKRHVYYDRTQAGTLYCQCPWRWVGRSAGRTELSQCGYEIRTQAVRAERIEWEHVVPASRFGQPKQCWREGGRSNCSRNDPDFRMMESDLHNLSPAVGEVNADRSNYTFAELPHVEPVYGACDFRVDTQSRQADPPDSVKGKIARIYFYMHDRYDLPMSQEKQITLVRWDEQFPPTDWERERDRRIAQRMGHSNPFVTGEKRWKLGQQNSGTGVKALYQAHGGERLNPTQDKPVVGNSNSRIYHLPDGCPSYTRVGKANRVKFSTEEQAISAGFKKAGNCR